MKLSKEDIKKKSFVDKHLTKIFPQLQINMHKVCGTAYDKWGDDLLQLSIEFFLQKELDVQYESCVTNRAENFITYIANFQLKSSTSRFWHTHRKFINNTREIFVGSYKYSNELNYPTPFEDEISELQMCIDKQMKNLNPFQQMLITEKVNHGSSFVEISEKFDIPYSSLQTGLKRILNKIKEECQYLK